MQLPSLSHLHLLTRLLGIVLILTSLSGCVLGILGGATSGALLSQDRRTLGTITEDQGIELKASTRVTEKLPTAHINIRSFNRMVLISGEVSSAGAREEAERIVRGVESVQGVYNEIQIQGVSDMKTRANDVFITSKIKTRLIDSGKVSAVNVKINTENGVVYLMGLVKHEEADAAAQIASTTSGTQKVVRLFEYLD
ncbi:MAG: BON domain-containing protein [Betaproteobacteria bacterium]|jgi:osmotically-inducible protein OsmY